MSRSDRRCSPSPRRSSRRPARTWIRVAAYGSMACVALMVVFSLNHAVEEPGRRSGSGMPAAASSPSRGDVIKEQARDRPSAPDARDGALTEDSSREIEAVGGMHLPDPASFPETTPRPEAEATVVGASPARDVLPARRPHPSARARALVDHLTRMALDAADGASGLAPEWRRQLERLAGEGASGVAAIEEFLQRYEDIPFPPGASAALGAPTLRAALIDTLGIIGGPEALAVSLDLLDSAVEPREVALLARTLETQAALEYYPEIMSAARRSLAMAAGGELPDQDVAPLFEVFARYGAEDVTADLTRAADRWNHYAPAALAKLPNGAGVSSLIQLASSPGAARIPALQSLAGAAAGAPDARHALLQMAHRGEIESTVWPYVAGGLTGDEVQMADSVFDEVWDQATGEGIRSSHIRSGNQTLYRMPTRQAMSPDLIAAQLRVVEDLLAAAHADPDAVDALEQTRGTLLKRLHQAPPDESPGGGGSSL